MTRFAVLFALIFSTLSPVSAIARDITVFAAASLRGALDEIAAGYPSTVRLSFGGSGTMARQVAAGAPADVVLLANTAWMEWLTGQGVLPNNAPTTVAHNQLVVIAAQDTSAMSQPADLVAHLGTGRLAMGQRDAVPAGIYARQWLENAGLWPDVQDQLAETDNVRAALALVARGEAPLGIVYASDAQATDKVTPIWNILSDTHDPILYPAAALSADGKSFLSYLLTNQAQMIFANHGFIPVRP